MTRLFKDPISQLVVFERDGSCNAYDKDGQTDFEEFVCCVTQHKFYSNH